MTTLKNAFCKGPQIEPYFLSDGAVNPGWKQGQCCIHGVQSSHVLPYPPPQPRVGTGSSVLIFHDNGG